MNENYQLFEETLQNYFSQQKISGRKHNTLEIKLETTQQGTWKKL
jgi:hypothetical protein